MQQRHLFQNGSRASVREQVTQYGPDFLDLSGLVRYVVNPHGRREEAVEETLRGLSPRELVQFDHDPNLTDREARIMAVVSTIVRRVLEAPPEEQPEAITSPDIVAQRMSYLRYRDREEFHVLILDTKNNVLADETVSVGSLDMAIAHPREVFKRAIKAGAAGILLVHNHPSGSPDPSPEDRQLTQQMKEAGDLLGIDVLDHVIIGGGVHFSFREKGLFG